MGQLGPRTYIKVRPFFDPPEFCLCVDVTNPNLPPKHRSLVHIPLFHFLSFGTLFRTSKPEKTTRIVSGCTPKSQLYREWWRPRWRWRHGLLHSLHDLRRAASRRLARGRGDLDVHHRLMKNDVVHVVDWIAHRSHHFFGNVLILSDSLISSNVYSLMHLRILKLFSRTYFETIFPVFHGWCSFGVCHGTCHRFDSGPARHRQWLHLDGPGDGRLFPSVGADAVRRHGPGGSL